MSRRPMLRQCDIDAATALAQRGMKPTAIDVSASGVRFRFDEGRIVAADDLDAELAAFEAKHREG